jgi:hypothetical protein
VIETRFGSINLLNAMPPGPMTQGIIIAPPSSSVVVVVMVVALRSVEYSESVVGINFAT